MATTTIFWAGKDLDGQEEARLRKLVHTLHRAGMDELAEDYARFLPERDGDWTAPERRLGGIAGPALTVESRLDGEAGIALDSA